MVKVVVDAVLYVAALVCCTQTVCPLLIVPDALVNNAVQPIEYVPPTTEIGDGLLIPLIVTIFDVNALDIAAVL